ncbi:MAG: signal recognition particle protein [candidate division WOR-3 bacterium]|nr:MAG: signal recognition particle protein [candidate division WOR-3 bacterium]
MFDTLIDTFGKLKRKILGYGRITDSELDAILKDIRITLLEADVHYKVAREFIDRLRVKCEGSALHKSIKPGDLVLKAVYEELTELLGGSVHRIAFATDRVIVISLLGLQGVGKTTTAVKLANVHKDKNVLLVPADAKRPAAYEQLQQLGQRIGVEVFPLVGNDALETVRRARTHTESTGKKLMIIDTAGRLHIDDELIHELQSIHEIAKPQYRLLVADGMTGQDAVNQASSFKEKTGLDGAILTKLDGDARGGAALSIARAAGVPLYYVGTGEDLSGLDVFYPDRIAQRILGMGDIAGLVDKVKAVEQEIDQEKLRSKMLEGDFNFEDFLEQMKMVRRLGPMKKLAAMIPGVKEADVDEREIKKVEAIVYSMTRQERLHPGIINGSRKRRIAAGSGTSMQDVNKVLKQFTVARDMLKKYGKSGMGKILPGM